MIDLRHGSNLDVLPTLADNSVDAIVTDPPYELGFMGKSWDASGIAYNVQLWRECLRVLKPGGHLLAFSGSRTYHRMTCAIEDAGFDVRDQIMWIYGSGFPKSHNLTGDRQGWGTALKPAHEPICVARKPLIGTVAANVLAHGTGAINVDGCRVDGKARPLMAHNGNSNDRKSLGGGVTTGAECIGQTTQGRWPANLIHDGSEEVLACFPTTTSGNLSPHHKLKASDNRSMSGANQERNPRNEFGGDTGSAARFFYCAKASKADRQAGNIHPTVKPTDLMRYLCRLITPPNGVILDPFMGSGSTGKAAVLEGFDFIGIDMTAEYVAIADARIKHAANDNQPPPDLLSGLA